VVVQPKEELEVEVGFVIVNVPSECLQLWMSGWMKEDESSARLIRDKLFFEVTHLREELTEAIMLRIA
jgi:hypothetical protein